MVSRTKKKAPARKTKAKTHGRGPSGKDKSAKVKKLIALFRKRKKK